VQPRGGQAQIRGNMPIPSDGTTSSHNIKEDCIKRNPYESGTPTLDMTDDLSQSRPQIFILLAPQISTNLWKRLKPSKILVDDLMFENLQFYLIEKLNSL
jgi:hypothetical protein